MGHVKISSDFWSHSSVLGVSNASLGLWVKAASWCSSKSTTVLPFRVFRALGGKPSMSTGLTDAGLWELSVSGYSAVPSRLWLRVAGKDREKVPASLRARVLERDGYRCLHCSAFDDLQMDHIYPWSRGGKTTFKNLQTLCGPCNRKKGAKVDGERQGKHTN